MQVLLGASCSPDRVLHTSAALHASIFFTAYFTATRVLQGALSTMECFSLMALPQPANKHKLCMQNTGEAHSMVDG